MLRLSGREALEDTVGTNGGDERGARKDVIDAFAEGTVGGELLSPFVNAMAPGVHEASDPDFEFQGVGAETPDPAAIKMTRAPGGFDVRVDINRLIEVDISGGAVAEGVENVVSVLGAEAREDDFARVCDVVSVGVLHIKKFGGVGDIGAVSSGENSGGDEQAVGEDGGFIGAAVAVGVLENDNFVIGDFARFELGIDAAGGDPQAASGVPVRLDRFGDIGIGREELDLEAFSDTQLFELFLRVGIGDVREIALGERGRGKGVPGGGDRQEE